MKRTKINEKEAGIGPYFLKKVFVRYDREKHYLHSVQAKLFATENIRRLGSIYYFGSTTALKVTSNCDIN